MVTYEAFILNVCESIAEGINFANKLIAHRKSGKMFSRNKLDIYDNVADPYLTLFYNALVGKIENEDENK